MKKEKKEEKKRKRENLKKNKENFEPKQKKKTENCNENNTERGMVYYDTLFMNGPKRNKQNRQSFFEIFFGGV